MKYLTARRYKEKSNEGANKRFVRPIVRGTLALVALAHLLIILVVLQMDNGHNSAREAAITSLQSTIAVLTEALRKEQATHERTQLAYINARAKLEFIANGWVRRRASRSSTVSLTKIHAVRHHRRPSSMHGLRTTRRNQSRTMRTLAVQCLPQHNSLCCKGMQPRHR